MTSALASVLEAIYQWVGSYGWAVVLFTLLIKVALFPLEYKSRKGMRQMERLNPQLQALQAKYANDKGKLSAKTAELYKKEGVSPMSGCLPMLVSMVILFIMFSAMRQVANLQMARQILCYLADGEFLAEGFLWIQNLWMPDSPFAPALPSAQKLAQIPAESWAQAYAALSPAQLAALPDLAFDFSGEACGRTVESIAAYMTTLPAYTLATQTVPQLTGINLFLTKISVYAQANGWLLLPILSCGTQLLTTKFSGGAQAKQNKLMTWGMPLFSLFICLDYSAAFALYWVASNCFALIQTLVIRQILNRKSAAQTKKLCGNNAIEENS